MKLATRDRPGLARGVGARDRRALQRGGDPVRAGTARTCRRASHGTGRVSAPILVAVGDRISVSELNGVIESARVVTGVGTDESRTVVVGPQPAGELACRGSRRAADRRGRRRELALLTVEVGTTCRRQATEPSSSSPNRSGAVQERVREIRRGGRSSRGCSLRSAPASSDGSFGRRAARPLTRLQQDAAAIGSSTPPTLAVAGRYGTPEVDDVAAALNSSLADLGDAIERREEALAAARNFAASATHELRTPLQSAMTNLDVRMAGRAVRGRVASVVPAANCPGWRPRLATVQALSQADLAQPEWFEPMDVEALGDLADEVTSRTVGKHRRDHRAGGRPPRAPPVTHPVWPDGVRLALDNVLRNALTHGRPGRRRPRPHRRSTSRRRRHRLSDRRRRRAGDRPRRRAPPPRAVRAGAHRHTRAAVSASPSPTGSPAPTVAGSRSCRARIGGTRVCITLGPE